MTNLLENAITQLSADMLDNIAHGQEVKLNSKFSIYKYAEEEHFVLIDTEQDTDVFVVLKNGNNYSVILEEI